MAIKVYNVVRLLETRNGKFTPDSATKVQRNGVKIDERDAALFNKQTELSGIRYDLDEKATAERNAPKAEPIDRDALKAEATELGIEFQNNIKTDVLIALINEKKEQNK
jgi:hypothetical protein